MSRQRVLYAVLCVCIMLVLGATAAQAQGYVYVDQWGSFGPGNGQFNHPYGVAVDGAGNTYVADSFNSRIQKFASDRSFVTKWGTLGPGEGQFMEPYGVAADAFGNVYVADTVNDRIQKFTSDGTFVIEWGTTGTHFGELDEPYGVAVDAAGNVYVADTSNHRVQKFTANGAFLTSFGFHGDGDGKFKFPHDVAVDGAGNVYVSDTFNYRMQKLAADGSFVTKWGTQGAGDLQFHAPYGVAVDGAGNVYVVDRGNTRTQKFASDGSFLTKWGTPGAGNGQFNEPYGVAVDASGNVYVADTGNNRIQVFAPVPPNVVSPNDAGVLWHAGCSYPVKWEHLDGSQVKIELLRAGVLDQVICASTGNDGTYRWLVPAGKPEATNYKVRVSTVNGSCAPDTSDNNFTIATPRVIEPSAAGVTWERGTVCRVRWEHFSGDNVRIELWKGAALHKTIRWTTPNDGRASWRVRRDEQPGDDYRIRVRETEHPELDDYSDNYFTVPAPKVLVPSRAGIVVEPGTTQAVKWEYFLGNDVRIQLWKGGVFDSNIRATAANDGRYNWQVPANLAHGTDYSVRIRERTSPCFEDFSDNYFEVGTKSSGGSIVISSLAVTPTSIGAEVIFTLSADAAVTCELLNIAGRPVRTIVADRPTAAGMNSLAWDGKNAGGCAAPSGTYLVRLSAASSDGSKSQSLGTVVLRR